MKVTLNWLKQYVAFDWSADVLAEHLTMLGLEVEHVTRLGGRFEGIVVGQVLTREKHPNADKLSVCRVNDGTVERQIVCGAHNFQPGDRVALILPGHALPKKPGDKEPFVIKVGRIRGVESQGMMCSAEELGINPEAFGLRKEDGILILDKEAKVGLSLAAALGCEEEDVVLDLEITPNRPDLNSVIGIAREISAVTGNRWVLPTLDFTKTEGLSSDLVAVELEAPDLCPRYTARVIRGCRVGPSANWLRKALEKIGLRSINNVVDITNYVMMVTGQPLHAFDYRRVSPGPDGRKTIVVRRARPGEKLVTLDERELELTPDNLLIADPEKAIALAGIMGGRNSQVSGETSDVLLESAYFSPTNIRRSSKALGLHTDASYRFERGADPEAAESAGQMAAALLSMEAGGVPADGMVDAYPERIAPRQVSLRHAKVNALLGLSLRTEEIEFFLGQAGLKVANRRPRSVEDTGDPGPVTLQVPTFRVDLKREADLIEEVARLYGVDRIPSTEPRRATGSHPFDQQYDVFMEVRRLLAGLGLVEAQGQTLISRASIRDVSDDQIIRIENPLSSEMDVLRPSLIPGLLDVARHNLRHQNGDVALFELGRVFRKEGDQSREGWRIALVLTGLRRPRFWAGPDREARCDAHDLKGMLEEFLERLGLGRIVVTRRAASTELYLESATLALGGKLPLGEFGQVQPSLAKGYDLRDPVFVAELDLNTLIARRNVARSYKAVPAFPAIRRDAALIMQETVTHESVLQVVRETKAQNLEGVELFDVFRGGNISAGQKSVAYAFTYRAPDRTLTDAEVNAAHEVTMARLKEKLGAIVRE